jgi:glycogen(starch) synthase
MKVLLHSHFFAPSIGGVETIVLSLARGLAELRTASNERQFDISVVTQTPAGDFDDRSLAFPVVRQPGLFTLWRLIRECDVAHLAGPSLAPLFLAWLAGKPVFVEHHGYQAICPNGVLVYQPDGSICPGHFQARRYGECVRCQGCQTSRLASLASVVLMFPRSWLTHRAATNVAISRHVLERHALPRSTVVYYGIENTLSNDGAAYSSPNTAGKICFAYVGRLVPEKGIPILLQASRKLMREGEKFEVRLIGDGPERPKLETIIKREGLETCVRITGYATGAALAGAIRDVRVVVMPSIWEETAGLAAMEQMMRGKLVIASNVGGLGEIVGDAGLRCEPGNADALADCMTSVLRNPSLIDSFGHKARERAHNLFLRQRMIGDHARLYLELSRRADL